MIKGKKYVVILMVEYIVSFILDNLWCHCPSLVDHQEIAICPDQPVHSVSWRLNLSDFALGQSPITEVQV
jgi:hypothetical protein